LSSPSPSPSPRPTRHATAGSSAGIAGSSAAAGDVVAPAASPSVCQVSTVSRNWKCVTMSPGTAGTPQVGHCDCPAPARCSVMHFLRRRASELHTASNAARALRAAAGGGRGQGRLLTCKTRGCSLAGSARCIFRRCTRRTPPRSARWLGEGGGAHSLPAQQARYGVCVCGGGHRRASALGRICSRRTKVGTSATA
jgi:hypothetical protein